MILKLFARQQSWGIPPFLYKYRQCHYNESTQKIQVNNPGFLFHFNWVRLSSTTSLRHALWHTTHTTRLCHHSPQSLGGNPTALTGHFLFSDMRWFNPQSATMILPRTLECIGLLWIDDKNPASTQASGISQVAVKLGPRRCV